MVHQLQNFIFGVKEGEDDLVIIETYMRPLDTIFKRIAAPWTGQQSFRGKLVYVLVSSKTGSAAEDLAFSLKNHKRAILVGETTAGAGHPVNFFFAHPDLLVMCAIGRSYDPITNKGWEGTGVLPDIEIEADQALEYVISQIP
jgi:C-terminal processing protease CtpA/Prc